MKHIFTTLIVFLSLWSFSQTTMNIYENNGSSQQIPLSSIDSITYTVSNQTTMNIYENNGSSQLIPLSSIDSITYTLGNVGNLATLTTLPVDSITSITAVSGGNITNSGGTNITNRGVCWSTSPNPTTANNTTSDAAGTGSFTSDLTGLLANTTYYVCAYATNSAGTAYGNQLSFTTTSGCPYGDLAGLDSIVNITNTTATVYFQLSGVIVNPNSYGFCWSTTINPTIFDSTFSSSNFYNGQIITGLTPGTTYYIRIYYYNAPVCYSNQLNFTTDGVVITTDTISNNGGTTASSGGNISNDGGATITSRGVCWGTTSNPLVTGSHTSNGTGKGNFTSSIAGLTPLTVYYVRAYATNSLGTFYGNQLRFTAGAIPTLTTNSITNITNTAATGGGNISNDGGLPVTTFGVCWSTSPNPTTANSTTEDGSGTGNFTSNITGLTAGTTYYVRAYATNSLGTAYGNEVSFATTSLLVVGQTYQGGIIAYILQPGDLGYNANVQHGLIATPSDQALNSLWNNGSNTTTGATGTAIGTGASNTAKIIASQGTGNYAASICTSLNIGGYTDWYLPSLNELKMLALSNIILDYSNYWSSTEYNSNNAYQETEYGTQSITPKSTYESVRAVRSF